jgi:hypothetical protein
MLVAIDLMGIIVGAVILDAVREARGRLAIDRRAFGSPDLNIVVAGDTVCVG